MDIIEYVMKKTGTKNIKDLDGLTIDFGDVWLNFYVNGTDVQIDVIE